MTHLHSWPSPMDDKLLTVGVSLFSSQSPRHQQNDCHTAVTQSSLVEMKWSKKWQSHITTFCIWRFSIKLPFLTFPSALLFKSKTLVREKLLKSMTSLSVLSTKKKKNTKQKKSKQIKLIVNTPLLLKHLVAVLGQATKISPSSWLGLS